MRLNLYPALVGSDPLQTFLLKLHKYVNTHGSTPAAGFIRQVQPLAAILSPPVCDHPRHLQGLLMGAAG